MLRSGTAAFVLVTVCFCHVNVCAQPTEAEKDNADAIEELEDVKVHTHERENSKSINIFANVGAIISDKDGTTDISGDQSTFSFLKTTLAPLASFLFGRPVSSTRENSNNAEDGGDLKRKHPYAEELPGYENGLPSNVSEMYASESQQYPSNGPNLGDLARYMETCDNCLSDEGPHCPRHDSSLQLKHWMTMLHALLTNGCQDKGDGGWSSWRKWSSCSVSCGQGVRTRTRACNNPTPKGGGKNCPGEMMSTETCRGPECVMDGNWGPWEPWGQPSMTCGVGVRLRLRRCYNSMPNYWGQTCQGDTTQSQTYNTGMSCCVDGNWGPWEPWGQPSVPCGVGVRLRSRLCDNPIPNYCGRTCQGNATQIQMYNTGMSCGCVHGNWGPWRAWSSPNVTCGSGTRHRQRRCDSPRPNHCGRTCPGLRQQTELYNGSLCSEPCVDGNWGQWGEWSSSSLMVCQNGTRLRTRNCDSPSPNYCGSHCPGSAEENETVSIPCETKLCVDGNWGQWGEWSDLGDICDTETEIRTRNCDSPSPTPCGSPCPGSAQETRKSGRACGRVCDEHWGRWYDWGRPGVTCGPGILRRKRDCVSPKGCPPCPGLPTQTQRHDFGPCPGLPEASWGEWEDWQPCDCSLGVKLRRRACEEVDKTGQRKPVDLSRCETGISNQTQPCDVLAHCPDTT